MFSIIYMIILTWLIQCWLQMIMPNHFPPIIHLLPTKMHFGTRASFTIPLFERASHALANLIYTAWIQAGSPSLSAAGVNNPLSVSNSVLEQNSPNPFRSTTHFVYTVKETSRVFLHVRDMNGDVLDTIADGTLPAGKYSGDWEATSHPAGIYYLVLNTGKFVHVKKMVFLGD